MFKTFSFLFFLFLLPFGCLAQYSITGRILNQADTKPVANASVFLSNATVGTRTANDGIFTLKNVRPGKYQVVVSIVGFEKYEQTVQVTNKDINLQDALISPKTIALSEVKVRPKDEAVTNQNLKLFTDYFLGTSGFAKDCTILNPQLLDLDFDEETSTLSASTSDFLEIDNNALGYKIHYLLTSFTLNTKELEIHYEGSALFTLLYGTPSQERQWQKNREEVYENSSMHFFRAAVGDQLAEAGFMVQKLALTPNSERPGEDVIKAELTLFKNSRQPHARDSLAYWKKKAKLPQVFQHLIPGALKETDVVKSTSQPEIYSFECNNCSLVVTFNKNRRFPSSIRLDNLDDPYNREITLVSFNSQTLFDKNGAIMNPNSMAYSGVWGNNRIAQLLPSDYESSKSVAAPIDNTIIKDISNKLSTFSGVHVTEKVYLHLTKSIYFPGDTIWYKAYTVIGDQHKLSALSGVLHVELINPGDSIIKSQNLPLNSGLAWGDIALSKDAKPGTYRIRAYTNWMRNAGQYFYDQQLQIAGAPPLTISKNAAMQPNIDIQFFPEGGEIVSGVRSMLAVKAINAAGFGEDIKGTIEDNDGNVVADFATRHLGMGVVTFTPKAGKTYKGRIKGPGESSFIVDLPKAKIDGFSFSVNNTGADSLYIFVAANEKLLKEKPNTKVYVLGRVGGKVYYSSARAFQGKVCSLAVDKSRFPSGIVQFTLFSETGEPLNERMVFINNNDMLKLKLNSASAVYFTRQKVIIDLGVQDYQDKPATGSFSVSVINESKLGIDDASESTILTNLLLTSDLQGYIEKPNYYFAGINEQTKADLDVLMMTQGYRRFEWKQVLENNTPITYQPEKSLELTGRITTPSGKPIPNGKVTLSAIRESYFTDTTTDINGNFKFTSLDLPDTAKIILNARNGHDGKNVTISIKKAECLPVTKQKQTLANLSPELQLIRLKSFAEYLQRQKEDSLKGVQQLKEVNIQAKKIAKGPDLSHSTNMNGQDRSNQVIMGDQLQGCINLTDCLIPKITGAVYKNKKFYSTRSFTHIRDTPVMVVIIDGSLFGKDSDDPLSLVSPEDVHSIEILRSGAYLAIYGSNAAGGAIIITTKRGGENNNTSGSSPSGLITLQFPGYYKSRVFYSPKYTGPKTMTEPPDLRNQVYWNPNVITDKDGKASFEYFNNDTKGTYRVVIEGIDDDGNLGRLVYRYKVE